MDSPGTWEYAKFQASVIRPPVTAYLCSSGPRSALFLPLCQPYVTISPLKPECLPGMSWLSLGWPANLGWERDHVDDLRVSVGAATETGPVREQNEDAYFVAEMESETARDNGLLLAVADGMGGHQHGEVASRLAIETLREEFYKSEVGPTEVPQRLKQAFRRANEQIYESGTAGGEANMMGTTLVAAVIRGNDLTIANVGDSRAYLVRAKRATQVTRDHSLVAEQVATGAMTEDEARESQHRNIITRALGHRQRVDVDIFEIRLLADDRLVLTTDGLYEYVPEDVMVPTVLNGYPEDAARELVTLAIANQSNDNATAVVAWSVPSGVSMEPEAEVPAEGGRSMLVPVLVGIALLVFIAIIGVILFMGMPVG